MKPQMMICSPQFYEAMKALDRGATVKEAMELYEKLVEEHRKRIAEAESFFPPGFDFSKLRFN